MVWFLIIIIKFYKYFEYYIVINFFYIIDVDSLHFIAGNENDNKTHKQDKDHAYQGNSDILKFFGEYSVDVI